MKYLLLFLFPIITLANTNKIDSLKKVLLSVKEDTNKVAVLNNISEELSMTGESALAQDYSKKALQLSQTLHFKSGEVESYLKLGSAAQDQSNFEEAISYYSKAREICIQISSVQGIFKSTSNIANMLVAEGKYEDALKNYNECIVLAKKLGQKKFIAKTYFNIGVVFANQGNFDMSLGYFLNHLQIQTELGDKKEMALAYGNISSAYAMKGNFFLAIEYSMKALAIAEEGGNKVGMAILHSGIGSMYAEIGNKEAALINFKKALEISKQIGYKLGIAESYNHIGESTLTDKNAKETMHYFKDALAIFESIQSRQGISMSYYYLGTASYRLKNYSEALLFYNAGLKLFEELDDKAFTASCLTEIARVYIQTGESPKAISLLKKSIQLAVETGGKIQLRDAYENIAVAYGKTKDYKNAFEFDHLFSQLNDSIANTANTLHLLNVEAAYQKTKNEKLVSDKEYELVIEKTKHAAQQRFFIVLIIVILLMGAGTYFLYNNNKTKQKLRMEKRMIELEQKALSLQMNPHFIFNSLNSISSFIAENNPDSARTYLSKFAGLMRTTLENSKEESIPLQEEINSLKYYLELEQLRFNNKFDFTIHVGPDLDPESVLIPPILIQPFIENSILHGVATKSGKGKIDIRFQVDANFLLCEVEDNGIGREKAFELKNQQPELHKSMGMQVTQERLDILNIYNKIKAKIIIKDLVDENQHATGTSVLLNVPLQLA